MKEYKQITLSVNEMHSIIYGRDELMESIADGWTIESSIPVGNATIVILYKITNIDPDERA